MEAVKGLVGKVERVQTDTRALKREVTNNSSDLEKMRFKIAALKDQDWRNNVRITGIAANREGNDAVAYAAKEDSINWQLGRYR